MARESALALASASVSGSDVLLCNGEARGRKGKDGEEEGDGEGDGEGDDEESIQVELRNKGLRRCRSSGRVCIYRVCGRNMSEILWSREISKDLGHRTGEGGLLATLQNPLQ
jgi:hypothetical protein